MEATKEQLKAIADAALAEVLPEGWTITYTAPNMSRHFDWHTKYDEKCVLVPEPLTPSCLFVMLHELGHVQDYKLHGCLGRGLPTRPDVEQFASDWAKARMEAAGLEVPAEIWAEAQRNADGAATIYFLQSIGAVFG